MTEINQKLKFIYFLENMKKEKRKFYRHNTNVINMKHLKTFSKSLQILFFKMPNDLALSDVGIIIKGKVLELLSVLT